MCSSSGDRSDHHHSLLWTSRSIRHQRGGRDSQRVRPPPWTTRVQQGPPGSTWDHQDPPGSTRYHLGLPGSTRVYQGPPGSTRYCLGPPGSTRVRIVQAASILNAVQTGVTHTVTMCWCESVSVQTVFLGKKKQNHKIQLMESLGCY